MKVRIYNYPPFWSNRRFLDWYYQSRYGVDSWEVKKKKTSTDKFVDKAADKYEDWVLIPICRVLRKLHDWRGQYHVRIDKFDTWSMDHTLAHIVVPMLKQLKENKHGAPNTDKEDAPAHLWAEPNENGDVDEFHFDRWDWIMGEMIFAFEKKVGDSDWMDEFRKGESDYQFKPVDREGTIVSKEEAEYFEMVEGENHTLVTDWEGIKEVEDRIQNGFRLFGKYYQNLWD